MYIAKLLKFLYDVEGIHSNEMWRQRKCQIKWKLMNEYSDNLTILRSDVSEMIINAGNFSFQIVSNKDKQNWLK